MLQYLFLKTTYSRYQLLELYIWILIQSLEKYVINFCCVHSWIHLYSYFLFSTAMHWWYLLFEMFCLLLEGRNLVFHKLDRNPNMILTRDITAWKKEVMLCQHCATLWQHVVLLRLEILHFDWLLSWSTLFWSWGGHR